MTKQKTSKQKIIVSILAWSSIYLMLVFGGFILGMVYEQLIVAKSLGTALSYTNLEINVNFNETKLTDELNTKFIPAFKSAFNETIKSFNKTK